MLRVVSVAFCLVAVVAAGPGGGHGGPGGKGGHGGPGGPLGPIFANLTEAQQTEAKAIFAEAFAPNSTLTKAEGKAKIEAFVATLSPELQAQINALKPTGTPPTPTGLSDAASALLAQIKAIKENDAITVAEEHSQIQALIQAADPTVVSQLPKFGGRGGPGGHGGKGGRGGPQSSPSS
uniref:DUF148 domain-containing protein n=1 Tax=Panagrellus redivivus TaxID=6233 RepID=A0A7E4VBD7_PANRE